MTDNVSQKMVRRLKTNGLVPVDEPIRLVSYASPIAVIKWEAVNAITDEPYKVGATRGMTVMSHHQWVIEDGENGWTVIRPGEMLPLENAGGPGIHLNNHRRRKE